MKDLERARGGLGRRKERMEEDLEEGEVDLAEGDERRERTGEERVEDRGEERGVELGVE